MPLLIGGKQIAGPKKRTLVIPRDEGNVVFHFVAVSDATEFDALCKEPIAQRKTVVGKGTFSDTSDPGYLARLNAHNTLRSQWYFLKSIEPSEIAWETIKMDDPETWKNWNTELKAAGFSQGEINKIWEYFETTNILTEEMIEEARKSFLAEQQVGA